MMSINVLTKEEKQKIKALIGNFRFDSPIGKDLTRYLHHGVGVHHAGLLPKYRLLVEKLAQAGLLKVICGTDTLGVGVNVPIRSVLFTQLCKYDGTKVRVLRVREFQQIAGRAGRRGYDTAGDVWAQAPAHVVENMRNAAKAAGDAKKTKKLRKKGAPEWGYAHWQEETFDKLVNGQPEELRSSFAVSHAMLLNLLDRPADDQGHDGLDAAKRLLLNNHEPRKRQRKHIRRAISIYRSLIDAEVVERLDARDDLGRRVRVTIDLQEEFALNQPLSLFAVEAIAALDAEEPDHALSVLSVIESVLESPRVIVAAQLSKIKDELVGEMKSQGIEYDERMERLEQVEPPMPLADFLFPAFDVFRRHHPWVGGEPLVPKAIVREMWETGMPFGQYIHYLGLKRSEGVMLRYLSDAYKALVQNVPEEHKTEEVYEITEWLGELVRQVDSSLINEWERLTNPDEAPATEADLDAATARADVTRNVRAFKAMVRNQTFQWVMQLAHKRRRWDAERPDVAEAADAYFEEHDEVVIDAEARGPGYFQFDPALGQATQIVLDPEGSNEWRFVVNVDMAASRETGEAVISLDRLERLA